MAVGSINGHSYNHGVLYIFIQHDQICTTKDVIYFTQSRKFKFQGQNDKIHKYISPVVE